MFHKALTSIVLTISLCTGADSWGWDAAEYVSEGRLQMSEWTLPALRSAFQTFDNGLKDQSCQDCSSNRELVFLHALTRAVVLVAGEDGGQVSSLFELARRYGIDIAGDKWELLTMTYPTDERDAYKLPSDAPKSSELSEIIETWMIPELEAIIAELDTITDTSADPFQIFFVPSETGLLRDLEVDYGDVLIFKGLLMMALGKVQARGAYDLHIDPDARIAERIYGNAFSMNTDLLDAHPDFLKVLPTANDANDGRVMLEQARENTTEGITYWLTALDHIRTETDPQDDDFLYIDPNDEFALNILEERLETLRASLLNDTGGIYPAETTRTYDVYDAGSVHIGQLQLVFGWTGFDGDGNSLSFSGAGITPSQWEVEWFQMEGSSGLWIDLEPATGDWRPAGFHADMAGDLSSFSNGTFNYMDQSWQWVSVTGLSGHLVLTHTAEAELDLNPLFGASARYPDPVDLRDVLPEFDQWNGILPGTMGHGLGNDATLRGIMPGFTQRDWQVGLDLQPGGWVSLSMVSPGWFTVDGSAAEWTTEQLIFQDIADDTDDPNSAVQGVDVDKLYLALDSQNLCGAITFFDSVSMGYTGESHYYLGMGYVKDNADDQAGSVVLEINRDGFGSVAGTLGYISDSQGYPAWVPLFAVEVAGGANAVEFKVPLSEIPGGLSGRFIELETMGWVWKSVWDWNGEDNVTHMKIAGTGTITGTVIYDDNNGGPIFVQAYPDPWDPDDIVASTMITGPGPYVLEGIGLGWQGHVRAFSPLHGVNFFDFAALNVEASTSVSMTGSDVTGLDIVLNNPAVLHHGIQIVEDIDPPYITQWYSFDAFGGGTYTLDLSPVSGQFPQMTLCGRDGYTEIIEPYYPGTHIDWMCQLDGTYYVKVYYPWQAPQGGRYAIEMNGSDVPDVRVATLVTVSPSRSDVLETLPRSVSSVAVGQVYNVEVWATDIGNTNTGLTRVYTDIHIDPSGVASVKSIDHSCFMGQSTSGTIRSWGIDELGGSSVSAVGTEPQWVRVATIVAQAENAGSVTFSPASGLGGVFTLGRGAVPWSQVHLDAVTVDQVEKSRQAVNLALKKAATQSSVSLGAAASRAVDGDTNGVFGGGSVAQTQLEVRPWWEVDLGGVYDVSTITLWNRTDSPLGVQRLRDFYILVSPVAFNSANLRQTLSQTGIWSRHVAGPPNPDASFDVGGVGRYVRIQLNTTNSLSLAEVQVYGAVHFADAELKVAVEQALGVSDPSPAEMLELTYLNAGESGITELTGLEHAVNLAQLHLGGNAVSEIGPLSGLAGLTHLDLSGNSVQEIAALSGMENLEWLNLAGNPLNVEAYDVYIPRIIENNPGMGFLYDPSMIAWNPMPANGADFVAPDVVLTWSEGASAALHNLFFGTDMAAVSANHPLTNRGGRPEAAYSPGPLAKNRTYYWRIDEHDSYGAIYRGEMWSFTVATPVFVDDDAPGDPLPQDPASSDPMEDGSQEHPYDSIQEAINAAAHGDAVVVMDGLYKGVGNRDIDPLGKSITIRSLNGPGNCVVDCQRQGRGFRCHNSELSDTVIEGFRIINGSAEQGAGIYCDHAYPTVSNCALVDCSPDAVFMDAGEITIAGTLEVVSGLIDGDGWLRLPAGATLKASNVQISCTVAGPGTIQVPAGKELAVIGNGTVFLRNLDEPGVMGSIQGGGLLKLKDHAGILNADIGVSSIDCGDSSSIAESRINTHETSLYGHVKVKDNALIRDNVIYASGDRYLDIEPATFNGVLQRNVVNVRVQKAQGSIQAGLFELRGQDLYCDDTNCPSGTFQVDTVPDFGRDTWTIDRIELLQGAELTLANRFDYQAPYTAGGNKEVLYVRELVLGANATLDVAFNRLYYQTIEQHPTSAIINAPLLGFSLDKILFDQADELASRVDDNNFAHPTNPNYDRVHVEHVEGLEADPTGVMQMRSIEDLDPNSPTFGTVVTARAKVEFAKCTEQEIVLRLQYLFEETADNPELVVYLSDIPELLAHDDPGWFEHYLEIGRITQPAYPRPGSAGSDRPGTFERTASTGLLDLADGAWVELELIESGQVRRLMSLGGVRIASLNPGGSTVDIDNIELIAHPTGVCMDFSGDYFPSENDFLIMIATCGMPADVDDDGVGSTHSMDVGFSIDGYVDSYDVASSDWLLHIPGHSSLCDLPLSGGAGSKMLQSTESDLQASYAPLADLPDALEDVLIVGKRRSGTPDRLYVFDDNASYKDFVDPSRADCNVRIVRDSLGQLYLINTEDGVVKLDGSNQTVIPRGLISGVTEPRYGTSATVSVGIQKNGSDRSGRPILDVAFDSEGYAYVVPVVVNPDGRDSYKAAAKLRLLGTGNPPYQIDRLYSDPLILQDNEYRSNPREIEIDDADNVYVLNVHSVHESDILWKYPLSGTPESLELGNVKGDPNYYIPDPLAMCVSPAADVIYIASGQYNPAAPNTSVIQAFSAEDLKWRKSIEVMGMQHITDIAEDPSTGCLWVVGFGMDEIPLYPNPADAPFYKPYIAKVPLGRTSMDAVRVSDISSCDLVLPMSVEWTGEADADRADADGDGRITFRDFATLASSWHRSDADPDWDQNVDLSRAINEEGVIDFFDLLVLTERWLRGASR